MKYPSKARQTEAAYYERLRQEAAQAKVEARRRLAGERLLRWASMYESGWRIGTEEGSWVWERLEAGRVAEVHRVSMTPGAELPEATAQVIDAVADSPKCPAALRDEWHEACRAR